MITTFLGCDIRISQQALSYRYEVTRPGIRRWGSSFDFSSSLNAYDAAAQAIWESHAERFFDSPAGLFSPDDGVILFANLPHLAWICSDCTGYSTALVLGNIPRDQLLIVELVPCGTKTLGFYQIRTKRNL